MPIPLADRGIVSELCCTCRLSQSFCRPATVWSRHNCIHNADRSQGW